MPLVIKDRVRQATTTTGTGTVTLGGAVTGFDSFSVIGNGNTTYYTIVDNTTGDWEVGIGTYTASGTTLSRDTVLSSSNSGSLVNFSAGTKDVWGDYPAGKAVTTDTLAYPPVIGNTTPNAATFTTLTATGQTSLGGAAGSESLRVLSIASSVNYWEMQATTANNGPIVTTVGTDATIPMNFRVKGSGSFRFNTNNTLGTEQFRITHTASAVNYVQVTGAATGAGPQVFFTGSDANVVGVYNTKGAGSHAFYTNSALQFLVGNTNSAVNYLRVSGAATNTEPVLSAVGSDTNISMAFQSKGTGGISLSTGSTGTNLVNGTTVTALTFTAAGNAYTSFPSIAISAPTTAGGVQATATLNRLFQNIATVASGGTGYTNGDVLTVVGGTPAGSAATLTVTAVSGGVITAVSSTNFAQYTALPTNPVSVTGGTGSGATLNLQWSVLTGAGSVTITNAGSGYVEQPTVTFSGGGGSAAAAYATVGSGTVIRSLGATTSFSNPAGEVLRLNGSVPSGTLTDYLQVDGGVGGSTNGVYIRTNGTTANNAIYIQSKGSGPISFFTNWLSGGSQQMSVTHTASAVNFVQVTGAATGGRPTISAQGSDANVSWFLNSKGTSTNIIANDGGWNFTYAWTSVAVNYFQSRAGAASQMPALSAQGSDTNISMAFQSKGTGGISLAPGSSGVNISNGGTVTAITRTTTGSGYSSFPTVTIAPPTTAGGVQATAAVASVGTITATIQSGGTGYTVGDLISTNAGAVQQGASTFTVTGVSGGVITSIATTGNGGGFSAIPTNPVAVTGGTGTGATLNLTSFYVVSVSVTGAGSGYVEQPAVTFSGGGGTGAAAYARIGSDPVLRGLGQQMNFATASGVQLQLGETFGGTTSNANFYIQGRTSGAPVMQVVGSDANLDGIYSSKGTGSLRLFTNGVAQEQLRVSHTASAVNYVQVTGAATGGNGPVISSQGSDANVNATIQTKGSGVFRVVANNAEQFRVNAVGSAANIIQVSGAASGSAPSVRAIALGGDTNVPLVLQPLGTGALQAQLNDGTATGGNARGANAVDWQTVRGAAAQVTSGQLSVIAGGTNNSVPGSLSVISGGGFNGVSGQYAVVSGGAANNAAQYGAAVVAGQANAANGWFNFVGGGFTNSGTSGTAVTTQATTTVTNGSTAVTLSGSNASIRVGQLITGTGINTPTYVAAISGTSLTLSQNAASSGSPTLSFFTPHGVVVGGGNNQATGAYSFIGGGGDAGTAGNRNVASGDWSAVVTGRNNTASGAGAFVGGGGYYNGLGATNNGNTASGEAAVLVGGITNTASGFASAILGCQGNLTNSSFSTAIGSFGFSRGTVGNLVLAAGYSPLGTFSVGHSQSALLILARQTTDATPTVLASSSSAAGTTNQVILPNNAAYYFKGSVIANVTGAANGAAWSIEGAIMRGANAASTVLIGTPTVNRVAASAGATAWTMAVTADTVNGGLAVTVTGAAGTTIRWVARLDTTEVTF